MSKSFIMNGRSNGKTKKLLEYAHEHGAVVLSLNPEAMRQRAESYGITCLDIRPYHYERELRFTNKEVVIDEMETFLEFCFGLKVTGFTQSEE